MKTDGLGFVLGVMVSVAGCSSSPLSQVDAGTDAGIDAGVCQLFDGGVEPEVALDNGPFDGDLPLANYASAFSTAYCEWYERCNPVARYVLADCLANIAGRAGWMPNFNGSEDPQLELSFVSAFLDGVDAGRIQYDAAAALTCLNHLRASACLSPVFYAGPETGCAPYWKGAVPTGGACENDRDCSAGLCLNLDGGCPGRCVALIGQSGATALANGQCDADAGLYDTANLNSPTGGSCDPTPDAGTVRVTCLTDSNCPGGQQCALNGVCAYQDPDPDCSSLSCPASGQCFAVTEPVSDEGEASGSNMTVNYCSPNVPDGGACNGGVLFYSLDSPVFQAIWLSGTCQPGLVCRGGTGAGNFGICQPAHEVGQPCIPDVQVTGCALGLACSCGICEIPPGPNAPCITDQFGTCRPDQAVCSNGECIALPTSGQACATTEGVCAQGLFCENGGVCTTPSDCSGETQ